MTVAIELLTVREACERLRCKRTSLYRLFATKRLKKTKVGRKTLVSAAQLDRYVAQQTR